MRALAISIAFASLAGCFEPVVELEDYPCETQTPPTYETFGRAFMSENCDRCHSAGEGRRHGAPESYRFDTLDDVRRHADRIFARSAATNTTMPPGREDPSMEDREQLAVWLACGAP